MPALIASLLVVLASSGTPASYVVIPRDAKIRTAPQTSAPAIDGGRVARPWHDDPFWVWDRVDERDGWTRLRTPHGSGIHCYSRPYGLSELELTMYVRSGDIAPVVAQRYVKDYDDGTQLVLDPGLGLQVAGPQRWLVHESGIRVTLELPPEVSRGHTYAPRPPARLDWPKGSLLWETKGTIGPATFEAAPWPAGVTRVRRQPQRRKKKSPKKVRKTSDKQRILDILAEDDSMWGASSGPSIGRIAAEDGPDGLTTFFAGCLKARARVPKGSVVEQSLGKPGPPATLSMRTEPWLSVDATATVTWPDGSPAGKVRGPHMAHFDLIDHRQRDSRHCVGVPSGPGSGPSGTLHVCFPDSHARVKTPRSLDDAFK